jgi:hypothetical protein
MARRSGLTCPASLEQLDGDASVALQVLGEKDDSHPTAAKLAVSPMDGMCRARPFAGVC